MAEVNDDVVMRSNIQKAAEKGYIMYDPINQGGKNKGGRWKLNDTDSGEVSELAPVRNLEDQTNALVYWFNNIDTTDSYNKVVELLTGQATKRTPKVDVSENSELEIKLKLAEAENEKLKLQKETAEAELEKAKLSVVIEKDTEGQNKKKAIKQ